MTFRIDPRNGGPAPATGVTVTDPLPAGWGFVSASGPNWSCSFSAPNVICTRATMPVGATDNITLDYRLRDGDLLTLDFAASVDGWVCDSAVSIIVGTPRPDDVRLIDSVERALAAGIRQATVGNRMGDISAAIGDVAADDGYPVNLDFGGHGVGRTMHGDPHVPNDGRPGRGLKLKAGLVIAIEPWFVLDTDEIYTDDDGWTLRSRTGSRAAHAEHTIALTPQGPIVLTARD